MTKKLQYIFIVLAACLWGFAACNDDDNNVDYTKYYDWRDQNSQLTRDLLADIRELGDDAYFTDSVPSITEPYAYCTVRRAIKTANEDSLRAIHKWFSPYYTSTLKVHYTLFNPDSVWARFEQYDVLDNQSQRNNPDVMNKIFGLGYKATDPEYVIKADTLESYQVEYYSNFTPGSVIKGWSDCLQQMHIGDCWLIHIPWYLAYGQSGSGSKIDPYSNLIFILELVDITSWGGNVDEGED